MAFKCYVNYVWSKAKPMFWHWYSILKIDTFLLDRSAVYTVRHIMQNELRNQVSCLESGKPYACHGNTQWNTIVDMVTTCCSFYGTIYYVSGMNQRYIWCHSSINLVCQWAKSHYYGSQITRGFTIITICYYFTAVWYLWNDLSNCGYINHRFNFRIVLNIVNKSLLNNWTN